MRLTDELPLNVEPYDSPMKADPREAKVETGNFVLLALHQVLLRVGWIFKTESIVMPMFMQLIGGGPVLQACLMVLNRLGFSVPPVLFSRQLKIAHRKKWWLAGCSLGMAVPFALLSALWFSGKWQARDGDARWWMPAVFLALYAVFFTLTGMNQLTAHSLQGKLVRATRRGRLFSLSVLVGSPLAIFAAWVWMAGWLAKPEVGFGAIFACSAVAFAFAGLVATALREKPDEFTQSRSPVWEYFHHSWQAISGSRDCRQLAILAVLFSMTFMLFPHYAAVATFGDAGNIRQMALWVCVQNLGTAVFSLIAGPLADRRGNRIALRLTILGTTLAPLLTALFLLGPDVWREQYAWAMFIPIGFTPVSIRLLINYALEIAPRHDHPKYVSAIGLCLAAPVILGAPLVGFLAKLLGYTPIFVGGAMVLAVAVWQTFRIAEPRHK